MDAELIVDKKILPYVTLDAVWALWKHKVTIDDLLAIHQLPEHQLRSIGVYIDILTAFDKAVANSVRSATGQDGLVQRCRNYEYGDFEGVHRLAV
jgi:hypothetical protein